MPNLTPGYDFGPTEAPRRATFLLQATGLQVAGVPLSSIDATVLLVSINSATSVTNLPAEGSLWVDAQNNLWGRTIHGNVRVKRYEGGWETNRFANWAETTFESGRPFLFAPLVANSTNITNARLQRAAQNGQTGAQLQPFVSQETTYSSVTARFRFTGRGPTRFPCPGWLPSQAKPRNKGCQQSSTWIAEDFDANAGPGVQFESDERAPEVGSSISECRGYFFGLVIKQQ